MARKKDVLETMLDDELLAQVFENASDTSWHQQAVFLINYRLAARQARFNYIVTIATVVMAVQAIVSIVALCLAH
jgi:hypothetical protein